MRIATASGIAIALVSPVLLLAVNPGERSTDSNDSKLNVRIYNIADLPVWRKGGKNTDSEFGPELLVKYLKLTVDPNSWNTGAAVRTSAKDASLRISQTAANHKKIAAAISSFRLDDPREVEEQVRID
jgi:hypothetical protein